MPCSEPYGRLYQPRRERGLIVLRPDLAWGRQRWGPKYGGEGRSLFIVAYTHDSAGRCVRVFYQRRTDQGTYGNDNWPIEARLIADVVPGAETPRRVPQSAR